MLPGRLILMFTIEQEMLMFTIEQESIFPDVDRINSTIIKQQSSTSHRTAIFIEQIYGDP